MNLFVRNFSNRTYKLNGIIKNAAEAVSEGSELNKKKAVIAYDKHVDLPFRKTYGNDEFLITRSTLSS